MPRSSPTSSNGRPASGSRRSTPRPNRLPTRRCSAATRHMIATAIMRHAPPTRSIAGAKPGERRNRSEPASIGAAMKPAATATGNRPNGPPNGSGRAWSRASRIAESNAGATVRGSRIAVPRTRRPQNRNRSRSRSTSGCRAASLLPAILTAGASTRSIANRNGRRRIGRGTGPGIPSPPAPPARLPVRRRRGSARPVACLARAPIWYSEIPSAMLIECCMPLRAPARSRRGSRHPPPWRRDARQAARKRQDWEGATVAKHGSSARAGPQDWIFPATRPHGP